MQDKPDIKQLAEEAHLREKRITGECVYHGRLLKLQVDQIELPSGRKTVREYLQHPGAVFLLALTPQQEILFVRQFRYPVGRVLLELPAGKLDPGEDPADCAARELQEETGWRAAKITFQQTLLPCVGYSDELLHFFLAEDLSPGVANTDQDEFLDCITLDLEEAWQMLMRGEIQDAKTAFGLSWYFAREGRPEGA